MKNIIVLLSICIVSCAEPNILYKDIQQSAWVCHNPGHELHGHVCVEEVHILRGLHQPCYWEMSGTHNGAGNIDPDSFCWLLEKKDCEKEELEWQRQNCHLLEAD